MQLALALVNNNTLSLLDLTGNKIGSSGVKLLSEAIKDHKTLKCFIVDLNGICTEGAYALADLLLN